MLQESHTLLRLGNDAPDTSRKGLNINCTFVTTFDTALAAFAVAASAQALSGADVEMLMKGKPLQTEDFGGKGTITLNADMTIAVDATKPDRTVVEDTGTFRLDGNGSCSTWKVLRTTEKCFTLEKTRDTTWNIMNLDGTVESKPTTMQASHKPIRQGEAMGRVVRPIVRMRG